MFKPYLPALLLASLVCAAPAAVAQYSGSTDQQAEQTVAPPPAHSEFDPATRTETLAKELNLSAAQKTKVGHILKAERTQLQNLLADSSVSRDDRRAKMVEIHKTSDDKVRAVLNSSQQKQWDEMQAKHAQ